MKPYIGIAGVTTREQSRAIIDQFHENGLSARGNGHQGAIGYCLTSGMINGHDPVDPRYITLTDLNNLDFKQSFGRNVIHYSPDPEHPDTHFINDLYSIFLDSEIYGSGASRVLQINRAFNVSAALIAEIKTEMLPRVKIIFQAASEGIEEMKPDELIARLRPYSKHISGILLDSSLGAGRKMDLKNLSLFVKALETEFPDKNLVFAGGLNPESVASQIYALSLVAKRPFSLDVESGVRNKDGDDLDLRKTESFIRHAAGEFEKTASGAAGFSLGKAMIELV